MPGEPNDPSAPVSAGFNVGSLLAHILQTPGRGSWTPPKVEVLQYALPQYEILSLAGRGGMGAVYKAWQKSLDRHVAIKVIPAGSEHDEAGFADRLKREAKAMARLNHPNIVSVHDAGEAADLLYFVMDFIEGTDLHQRVAQHGRLPPAEALSIIVRMCDALGYAHGKGVVHRDIKPSNVIIDTEGNVKVADFGLARVITSDAGFTASDVVMGTPDYMAPEQRKGMQVDHRADIYSLGVTLYQMLCGELPHGIFSPPSTQVPCDPRVDAIVSRALQCDPERRYQSTTEMKTAVEELETSHTADAPRGAAPGSSGMTPGSRSQIPVARALRRELFIASLLLLAGGLWWLIEHGREAAPRDSEMRSGVTAGAERTAVLSAYSQSTPATAAKDAPFVNSLGMKFVPVPIIGGPTGKQRVLFSVWETRVQDYGQFVADTKREWRKPAFEQAPTHPAVNVNWQDGKRFCEWLTHREHKAGRIGADLRYRLPSDHEWSCAAGVGDRDVLSATPWSQRDALAGVFAWGFAWPPPRGVGNFAGEEIAGHEQWQGQKRIEGWRDGFIYTAPVGSFPADQRCLHDLIGNVMEWCEDLLDPTAPAAHAPGASLTNPVRVYRGGAFDNPGVNGLALGYRAGTGEQSRSDTLGFRIVLAPELGTRGAARPPGAQRMQVPESTETPLLEPTPGVTPVAATRDAPFVNSFGMKFVPVPIAGGACNGERVLFSVWQTRVQDYAAFTRDTGRYWPGVPFARSGTHPATNMTWEDASAYCVWLTDHERKAGLLGLEHEYRLPSDHEWSCAIGIGDREDGWVDPVDAHLLPDVYPWGSTWPPPPGVGNYSGTEARAKEVSARQKILEGYSDPFPYTAPVGSFAPNALGLFDLGANVHEWAFDWFSPVHVQRVIRGQCFVTGDRQSSFLSMARGHREPMFRAVYLGFRVVLTEISSSVVRTQSSAESLRPKLPSGTIDAPFVNSLGMKFVQVPIPRGPTASPAMLFSVWETRNQDFAAYAADTQLPWQNTTPDARGAMQPAGGTSWRDAHDFCAWLTTREQEKRLIPRDWAYRLPSDYEWSCAVGIGEFEDPAKTPEERHRSRLTQLYPWGNSWPPPDNVGNYAGEESLGHEWGEGQIVIPGYNDRFFRPAPVGCFPPNRLGLYDLGGNVREWCEDAYDSETKVSRGSDFHDGRPGSLGSGWRFHEPPTVRSGTLGFRVVLSPLEFNRVKDPIQPGGAVKQ